MPNASVWFFLIGMTSALASIALLLMSQWLWASIAFIWAAGMLLSALIQYAQGRR